MACGTEMVSEALIRPINSQRVIITVISKGALFSWNPTRWTKLKLHIAACRVWRSFVAQDIEEGTTFVGSCDSEREGEHEDGGKGDSFRVRCEISSRRGPIGQHAGPTREPTLTLAQQPRPTPCHVPAALASRLLHVVPCFHLDPEACYPVIELMWDPLFLQPAAGRKLGELIKSKRVLSHPVVCLCLRASLFIHLF
ncbi:hypothetical protein MUK42_36255 [Musa troglodytarum]|uniref:Uncharacterized protein n=1 Tax=Musa troglodytarum TaxID=320322 RepID=A0A9E7EI75_9LILI|nr:hypothetical protein MUK42_36255 [Musa troglodytarum]